MPPIAQRTVQTAASYPAPSSVAAPKDIPLVLQTTSKECVSSAAAPVETLAEERAASAAPAMAGSAVHAATLETSKTAPSKKQVVVAPIALPSSAAAVAAVADVGEEGGGKSRAESFDADLERKFPGLCSGSWLPEIDAKIAYMKAKFKEMQVSVAKQLQKLGKEMQALEGTVRYRDLFSPECALDGYFLFFFFFFPPPPNRQQAPPSAFFLPSHYLLFSLKSCGKHQHHYQVQKQAWLKRRKKHGMTLAWLQRS